MTYPQHADFAAQMGTYFEVAHSSLGSLQLLLGTVNSASPPPVCAFSLIFLGDPAFALAQGIYQFAHAQLGQFDLFIVPLGPSGTDPRGRYEAVFNSSPV